MNEITPDYIVEDVSEAVTHEQILDDRLPMNIEVYNQVKTYLNNVDVKTTKNAYKLFLSEFKLGVLKATMEKVKGNKTHAANLLGLNRLTLRNMLREHDLDNK